jgi:cell wall-associated NlpC family hydrolase
MKLFCKYFIVLLLLSCGTSFAQKVIKHKVKSGESIYSIARKYDVTDDDIYELNPRLKGKVLGLKTIVEIPNKKYKEEETKPKEKKKEEVVIVPALSDSNEPYSIHTVSSKETLYSLSKQYGISMEAICELNPELKTGNLKKGAKLKFPNTIKIVDSNGQIKAPKSVEIPVTYEPAVAAADVIHKVQPKETLYRLSKKYGVSVSELQRLNPTLPSGFPVGFDLVVKKGANQVVETPKQTEDTPIKVVQVEPLSTDNMNKADFLIAKASQHIGTLYRSGGSSTGGFDCSGLMIATFKEIEMSLPRTSGEQSNVGITIDKSQAQKGDLIFFTTNGRGNINHVGMITEILDDEIKFIHSSIQAGVIISSTKEAYYAKRFVKVNRVLVE